MFVLCQAALQAVLTHDLEAVMVHFNFSVTSRVIDIGLWQVAQFVIDRFSAFQSGQKRFSSSIFRVIFP